MNIDDFLASEDYAKTTRSNYKYILELFTQHITPSAESPTPAELRTFIESRNWGNSMSRNALYAIRQYLEWRFPNHPAQVVKIKRKKPKLQRSLTVDQILKLLLSFDTYTLKGARDLAMAALFIDSGLRLFELTSLKVSDINQEQCTLNVVIKGGNGDQGVYSPETANIIENWLVKRKEIAKDDSLFINTFNGKGLTREGIRVIVRYWGDSCGFKISPHDFRRTFTTVTLENGASTRVVQLGGRWSDPEMVERYSRALQQRTIRPYLPIPKVLGY